MSADAPVYAPQDPTGFIPWNQLKALLIQFGVAALCVVIFSTLFYVEVLTGPIAATVYGIAAMVILTAVLGMNGLMKAEQVFHSFALSVLDPYVKHPLWGLIARPARRLVHFIHEVTNEGELAGIAVALFMAAPVLFIRGQLTDASVMHPHHLVQMAATLLGIMSMAGLMARDMAPFLALTEKSSAKVFGSKMALKITLWAASLLASFTGEPASAVLQLHYFKDRVKPKYKGDAAVGFGMAIGSGGGLTFFAAPPILIIWGGFLAAKLGWTLSTLVLFVGVPCALYVAWSAHILSRYVQEVKDTSQLQSPSRQNWISLLPMIGIVMPHVIWWRHLPLPIILLDVLVGVWATVAMHGRTKGMHHSERFAKMWQPWILAFLLIGLEWIGLVGDPLIGAIGSLIPTSLSPVVTACLLFLLTSWVSHFADNALAARVLIMIPIQMIPTHGLEVATLVAIGVVLGSLFGSILTISANLPNFVIARVLEVTPGEWFASGRKLRAHYITGSLYIAWITGMSVVIL